MLHFDKILCPTDFSEASYEGVRAADSLAQMYSAEVILVNVVAPLIPIPAPMGAVSGYDVSGYNQSMNSAAAMSLDSTVSKHISDHTKIRTSLLEGNAAEQIVALAEKEKAGVIVIATHGVTGWKRFVFGSVTEKVVRLAQCPVLTIPAPQGNVE